jgi:hypothetical protein
LFGAPKASLTPVPGCLIMAVQDDGTSARMNVQPVTM